MALAGSENRGGVKREHRKSAGEDCYCLFIIFKSYHKRQRRQPKEIENA